MRRERPRCRRAAEQRDELAAPDVDCHVTLPSGVMPIAMEARYHALIAWSVASSGLRPASRAAATSRSAVYFRPAFSRIAPSVARPLSVSVYDPLSRLCAMNPRMAMDCIAWARMPTAAWSMPVAVQNKITRSCALSSVVGFAMAYASFSRMPPSRARRLVAARAACPLCGGGGGGGFGGLGGSMRTNPFPVMAAPASAASDLTILHRRGPPISQ
jgi:hypothetical protein